MLTEEEDQYLASTWGTSSRLCQVPTPAIGIWSSNVKVAPGSRKRKNEKDDNDATTKNMMTFMLEDRKLELENQTHELAAQIQIQQMEEQA